jgi:putative ABC transport system permease protein
VRQVRGADAGTRVGDIRAQFLTEAVALSALGGLAGTVLGLAATTAYSAYQGWPVVFPVLAVLGGVAGAVVVGTVAGLHPSIRAARLTPTEALAVT